jgi:membrane protein required for colicin V production
VIAFQDSSAAATVNNYVTILQSLGWVDKTALAVLLVFFVLGLFKGLIWQVSRIGILLAAYFVAGRFGHDVASMLDAEPADPVLIGGDGSNTLASASPNLPPAETTIYLAYCLLFVGVLIVLSLLAMLLKKLADRAGLGFFDRLGGGVLGVATGACVVLACVFGINMFFPSSNLAIAAGESHSLAWSQKAIGWLGGVVDNDLRSVLSLQPLEDDDPAPNAGAAASGGRDDREPHTPLPHGNKVEGNGGLPGPSPGRTERESTGGDRNGFR